MSDLIFISGAIGIMTLCFGAMIALFIVSLKDVMQSEAPKGIKWLVIAFSIAFGAMILGIILKLLETL